jgi:hypothetical protein
MRLFLATGLGVLAATTTAMAAEVTSTKKAAVMTPIENLYGRVELRQTSLEWGENGDVQRGVTLYSLRPRLGTKLFNNRLDTFIEVPVASDARSSNFLQRQTYWLTTFNALETSNFSITPYNESFLAHEDKPFTTKLAVTLDAFTTIKTTAGDVRLHGGLEPFMETGTRATMTNRINREPGKTYSLVTTTEDGSAEAAQREPSTALEYMVGVSYVPSFAPKFSLSTDVYFDRIYRPVYDAVSDESGERLEKTGYAVEDTTFTDVILAYNADSLTTIQNRLMIYHDGLYAANTKGKATPRIQNRLSLIYKLF